MRVTDEAAICERCGSFAVLYASWDRAICEPCFEYRHSTELEPFEIGALMRNTFSLARELGLRPLLLLMAASLLSQLAVRGFAVDPQDGAMALTFLSTLPSVIFTAVLDGIAEGVVVMLALRIVLERRPPDWRAATAAVGRRLGALLALQLLLAAAFHIGLLLCIAPGFYFVAAFSLAIPVLLREGAAVTQSMERSRARLANRWGSVLLVQFVIMLAIGVVSWGPIFVLSFTQDVPVFELSSSVLGTAAAAIGQGTGNLLFASLSVVAYAKCPPVMRRAAPTPAAPAPPDQVA